MMWYTAHLLFHRRRKWASCAWCMLEVTDKMWPPIQRPFPPPPPPPPRQDFGDRA